MNMMKYQGVLLFFHLVLFSLNFPFRTPEQAKELFIQGIKHMKGLDPSVNVKMILVINQKMVITLILVGIVFIQLTFVFDYVQNTLKFLFKVFNKNEI